MLFVNEIFSSLQGEGAWTGAPSVFVRLQGCLVRCPWCDTKYTWKLGSPNGEKLEFAAKKADAPRWATASEAELVDFLLERYPNVRHVVFTGGEPLLFRLHDVCKALLAAACTVQIETSATEPADVPERVWVTASPKFGMPGGRPVLESVLARADEIKMAVASPADIKALETALGGCRARERLIYLQPVSQDPAATKLCIETALERGYRVSVQMHKYLNVR